MPYTRQLYVSFLLAALAFTVFLLSTYALPNTILPTRPSTYEKVIKGIVYIGLLITGPLALAFGVGALMWRINGGEPEREAMPLGSRIKGAGLLFVLAMLSYGSFFLF